MDLLVGILLTMLALSLYGLVRYWNLHKHDRLIISTKDEALGNLTEDLQTRTDEFRKLLSHKKSSEVRLGNIAEQLAPFLSDFPYDPKSLRFLGQPIDFVLFGDDSIRFIEVKSGNSNLSSSQRKARDLIRDGKVSFEIYRIRG